MICIAAFPPATSMIRSTARFKANSVNAGSTPRSKRKLASVFRPWYFAVFRTETG
jgi:hypothetical protein